MKVLVVGGGGREHALVWKLSQSPKVEKIYCAPGNAGTAMLAENLPLAADDVENLLAFAVVIRLSPTPSMDWSSAMMTPTTRLQDR